jgi:radical SAM superfamily enzyme
MLATAGILNDLDVDGKDPPAACHERDADCRTYRRGKVGLLDRRVRGAGVRLPERPGRNLIQRLTGDGGHDHLVAPLWSLRKFEVLNAIDHELERRGSRQGSALSELPAQIEN